MDIGTRTTAYFAIIGWCVTLVACGGTTASKQSGDNRGDPTAPAGAALAHVSPCHPETLRPEHDRPNTYEPCTAMQVTESETIDLEARVLTADGPVANQRVHFGIISPDITQSVLDAGHASFSPEPLHNQARGAVLEANAVATDNRGMAQVQLYAGEEPGVVQVVAWIEGASSNSEIRSANYLTWRIPVFSASHGAATIDVGHAGETEIEAYTVRLFETGPSCSELRDGFSRARDESSVFTPPTAVRMVDGEFSDPRTVASVTFTELELGHPYVVLVEGFGPGPERRARAVGCTVTESIRAGETIGAGVSLVDYPALLKDSYTVTHELDLNGTLAPEVSSYVEFFSLFVKSPAALLFGCQRGDRAVGGQALCPESDIDGLVMRLLNTDWIDSLNINASTIEQIVNSIIGDSIRLALDREIFDLIDGSPLDTGISVTRDALQTATKLRVKGTIEFSGSPPSKVDVQNGQMVLEYDEGNVEQRWTHVSFFDPGKPGCDRASGSSECRTGWIDLSDLTDAAGVISAPASATVVGHDGVRFGAHSMDMEFESLLVGALEHALLPRFFSDSAGSTNKVADLDRGCGECQSLARDGIVSLREAFANTLANCPKLSGAVQSAALRAAFQTVCINVRDGLIHRAEAEFRKRIEATGLGQIELETPPDHVCSLTVGQSAGADGLGRDMDGARCRWRLSTDFSSDSDTGTGEFFGSSSD